MSHALQTHFQNTVGSLPPIELVTDVAFPLSGGLEGAAAAFNGDIEADIYARPHNPTVRALADAVNRLDGGVGTVAYSSGQAAIRNVFQLLASADSEIILASHVFGGTAALQGGLLGRFGVTFKWADATDAASFEKQVTSKTRAIFVEGVANPASDVADFTGLRALADHYNIPLVVDNTSAPLALQPIAHGADIVVYSATKYLNGFGNAAAGIVVDSGRFNWGDDARFPALTKGTVALPSLAQRFNNKALIKGLNGLLTVDGAILAPEKAAIIYNNLPSLPQRLAAHIDSTNAVAAFLHAHPAVAQVHSAGLESDPNYNRARQYLPHGVSGPILVTFKGGRAAAAHVIDNVGDAFVHAVNIGDARHNLISHPATTTHRQLTETQRDAIGIKDGSLRLSIAAGGTQKTLQALDKALKTAPV